MRKAEEGTGWCGGRGWGVGGVLREGRESRATDAQIPTASRSRNDGPLGPLEFPREGKAFTHEPQERGTVFPSSSNTNLELDLSQLEGLLEGRSRGHPGTLVQEFAGLMSSQVTLIALRPAPLESPKVISENVNMENYCPVSPLLTAGPPYPSALA